MVDSSAGSNQNESSRTKRFDSSRKGSTLLRDHRPPARQSARGIEKRMNLRLLTENHDNATFYIFELATDDDAAFQMENSGNH